MRLRWRKDTEHEHWFIAQTVRYEFIMIAPPGERPHLWVQHLDADRSDKPIDERECRSRRAAELMAQRFEDHQQARRLR